jgi:phenylalanyl-tRNA synthetase beta chain
MNILIPHPWLLEHLDTKATPAEIQKYVSLCGPSIERIYEREGEAVYDIEVTTNRVDSMSVRGIAREAAVILNQFGIAAKLKPHKPTPISFDKKTAKIELPLPTLANNKKLCRRITCVVLANVERATTPEWMAKRLRQVELNVHDVVIDITNYITHELGHPCHAFDYDKIMEFGGIIVVKEAVAGKKFTTLDGNEYTTLGGELVFENENGQIIDLPGIKGTANTAIQDTTKNVLFWIENSVPEKIRFGSMSHAIRTVAAQLNEKNVDPHLALPVIEEGTALFQKLAGAQIASPLLDEFPGKRQQPSVEVSHQRITDYLGLELPVNRIAKILEDLGCQVSLKKGTFTIQPPTFRPDITIPADVIEEIARIYGYHNLPSVLMSTPIPLNKPVDTNFTVENRIKRFLAAIGWQEVYTYSMVSADIAEKSGHTAKSHLQIQNPLTDDRVYMRRSLLPSLQEILDQNPQYPQLSVFELANTYQPQAKNLPEEKLHFAMLSRRDLRAVKGDLEALLKTFFITSVRYKQTANHQAEILVRAEQQEKEVVLGTLERLTSEVVAIDIPVHTLLETISGHPHYQPLSKMNVVMEDLTFTLPDQTAIGEVMETMRDASKLIANIEFLSQYQQNISFRMTYHSDEKQMTDQEVSQIRQHIVGKVSKAHHAQLVGGLQ